MRSRPKQLTMSPPPRPSRHAVVSCRCAGSWPDHDHGHRNCAATAASASAAGPAQFTIAPPENASFGGPSRGGSGTATQLAVSPDGRHIVFVGARHDRVSDLAATGRHAGSNADSGNRTAAPSRSGRPTAVPSGSSRMASSRPSRLPADLQSCLRDAPCGSGGSWSRDDVILFAPGPHRPACCACRAPAATPTVATIA